MNRHSRLFACLRRPNQEKGAIITMSAVGAGTVILLASFTVNIGYISTVRGELQKASDMAALAALTQVPVDKAEARRMAFAFAKEHSAGGKAVLLASEQIQLGRYNFHEHRFHPDASPINAARVDAGRNSFTQAGALQLFFENLSPTRKINLSKHAVAVQDPHVVGVKANNHLIPYSVRRSLVDQDGNGMFDIGRQLNIHLDSSAPGNFGFLDFDGGSNDIPELRQYLSTGYDQDFVIPDSGSIQVSGSTGIDGNSVLDAFREIIGDIVFMPVHTLVTQQGSNAQFKVVDLIAIKITSVQLTGDSHQRKIVAEIVQAVSSNFIVRDPTEGTQENSSLRKLRLVE